MIAIYGTLVAVLLIVAALLFMNPEQCPLDYTQAQVDASNCIIGANIGLGLVFMLAAGIWVVAAVIAIGIIISRRKKTS